jgi:hypothetical protein
MKIEYYMGTYGAKNETNPLLINHFPKNRSGKIRLTDVPLEFGRKFSSIL